MMGNIGFSYFASRRHPVSQRDACGRRGFLFLNDFLSNHTSYALSLCLVLAVDASFLGQIATLKKKIAIEIPGLLL